MYFFQQGTSSSPSTQAHRVLEPLSIMIVLKHMTKQNNQQRSLDYNSNWYKQERIIKGFVISQNPQRSKTLQVRGDN